MRKVLVVLMILSVMGGAFAQGNWSVSAGAEIGTIIDFQAYGSNASVGKAAINAGAGYHRTYDWYDGLRGALNLGYNNGGLNISIGFTQNEHPQGEYAPEAYVSYSGDFYSFKFGGNIINFIDNKQNDGGLELWGNFSFFKGIMNLEVAHFSGNDKQRWMTESYIQGKVDVWLGANLGDSDGPRSGMILEFNVIDGLNVGVYTPNLFDFGGSAGTIFSASGGAIDGTPAYNLMEDAVKQSIFGLTFSMFGNFGVSAGFNFGESTFLLTGAVKNIFNMMGIGFFAEANFDTTFTMGIGIGVDFSGGNWGAALGAFFGGIGQGYQQLSVSLYPQFYYLIFPNSLAFILDAQIDLKGNSDIGFMVRPQIFINFKGEGVSASGIYWPPRWDSFNTGMYIRYRYANVGQWAAWPCPTNAVEFIFGWSM